MLTLMQLCKFHKRLPPPPLEDAQREIMNVMTMRPCVKCMVGTSLLSNGGWCYKPPFLITAICRFL